MFLLSSLDERSSLDKRRKLLPPTLGAGSLDIVGEDRAGEEGSIPFVCVYQAVILGRAKAIKTHV